MSFEYEMESLQLDLKTFNQVITNKFRIFVIELF